jgi:hypothetical protein
MTDIIQAGVKMAFTAAIAALSSRSSGRASFDQPEHNANNHRPGCGDIWPGSTNP